MAAGRERVTRALVRLTAAAIVLVTGGCRPLGWDSRPAPIAPLMVPAIERGALTYEIYCAGCHGADGRGYGPFALAFGLRPADLRTPGLATASDAALLDRLLRGTSLAVPARATEAAETRDVAALLAYLPRVAGADWALLRAGRVVYEESCAACHGFHGRGDNAVAFWLDAPDMIVARERQSDAALARISGHGTGLMPPLYGAFDRGELRALVAYIRHLSDGFAVYDTHCAACHGDDGQGRTAEDLLPPAVAAPPLRGPYAREQIRTMLRGAEGVMPHFAMLDRGRLEDVVAYLRAVVFERPHDSHPRPQP